MYISGHDTSTLFLFSRFLSIVFRLSISPCFFIIQINSVKFFRSRNISQFRVHIFIRFFYCLVQLLMSLIFQLPLSLRFSRRSRHTNLVSFVVFPSFACFICISIWFPALYIKLFCAFVFSLIASKRVYFLDVWTSTTISSPFYRCHVDQTLK